MNLLTFFSSFVHSDVSVARVVLNPALDDAKWLIEKGDYTKLTTQHTEAIKVALKANDATAQEASEQAFADATEGIRRLNARKSWVKLSHRQAEAVTLLQREGGTLPEENAMIAKAITKSMKGQGKRST